MAFTAAQKTLSYELLGLFEGGTFDWYDYNDRVTGEITSTPMHNQLTFATVVTRLDAIFTAIEAAADNRETRVGEILTEYSDVSLQKISVRSGGTSSTPGARYSTDDHIGHLRTLLQTHLGVRARHLGGGGGRNISVGR